MRIRGYREADRQACRSLWVELTEWHRQIFGAPEIGGNDPGAAFDEHVARVGKENVWVAEDGGRIVGLAGLIAEGEDPELEPVIVSEAYRGRGVGRALVQAVLSAAGDRAMVVRPVGRNAQAIRFFHALGFDVVSRLELLRHAGTEWRPAERFAGREFRV